MASFRFDTATAAMAALMLMVTAPAAQGGGASPLPADRADVTQAIAQAQQSMDRKDWTGALAELKQALRKDHRNADVYSLMGYSYRKTGQLDDAFDSYRAALRVDPDHRFAHQYMGEAYLQINEPIKAREHLAALKRVCGDGCAQYKELARALASWQPATTAAVRYRHHSAD